MKFLTEREMGIEEACDRLLGHPAYRCSDEISFLNTNESSQRVRKLISAERVENLKQTERVTATNFVDDYYVNRPDELENFCMLNIFMNFK